MVKHVDIRWAIAHLKRCITTQVSARQSTDASDLMTSILNTRAAEREFCLNDFLQFYGNNLFLCSKDDDLLAPDVWVRYAFIPLLKWMSGQMRCDQGHRWVMVRFLISTRRRWWPKLIVALREDPGLLSSIHAICNDDGLHLLQYLVHSLELRLYCLHHDLDVPSWDPMAKWLCVGGCAILYEMKTTTPFHELCAARDTDSVLGWVKRVRNSEDLHGLSGTSMSLLVLWETPIQMLLGVTVPCATLLPSLLSVKNGHTMMNSLLTDRILGIDESQLPAYFRGVCDYLMRMGDHKLLLSVVEELCLMEGCAVVGHAILVSVHDCQSVLHRKITKQSASIFIEAFSEYVMPTNDIPWCHQAAKVMAQCIDDISLSDALTAMVLTEGTLLAVMYVVSHLPTPLRVGQMHGICVDRSSKDLLMLVSSICVSYPTEILEPIRYLMGHILEHVPLEPLVLEVHEQCFPIEKTPTDPRCCLGILVNSASLLRYKDKGLKGFHWTRGQRDGKSQRGRCTVDLVIENIYRILYLVKTAVSALTPHATACQYDGCSRLILTLRLVSLLILDDLSLDANALLLQQKDGGGKPYRISRIAKNAAIRLLVLIDLQRGCKSIINHIVRYQARILKRRTEDLVRVTETPDSWFTYRVNELQLDTRMQRDAYQNMILSLAVTSQTININSAYLSGIVESATKPLPSILSVAPMSILSRPRGVIRDASRELKTLTDAILDTQFLKNLMMDYGHETRLRCIEAVNKVSKGLADRHQKITVDKWFDRSERIAMAIRREMRKINDVTSTPFSLTESERPSNQRRIRGLDSLITRASIDCPAFTASGSTARRKVSAHDFKAASLQVILAIGFSFLPTTASQTHLDNVLKFISFSITGASGVNKFIATETKPLSVSKHFQGGIRDRLKDYICCRKNADIMPGHAVMVHAPISDEGLYHSLSMRPNTSNEWPSLLQIERMSNGDGPPDDTLYRQIMWTFTMVLNRKETALDFTTKLLEQLMASPIQWPDTCMLPTTWLCRTILLTAAANSMRERESMSERSLPLPFLLLTAFPTAIPSTSADACTSLLVASATKLLPSQLVKSISSCYYSMHDHDLVESLMQMPWDQCCAFPPSATRTSVSNDNTGLLRSSGIICRFMYYLSQHRPSVIRDLLSILSLSNISCLIYEEYDRQIPTDDVTRKKLIPVDEVILPFHQGTRWTVNSTSLKVMPSAAKCPIMLEFESALSGGEKWIIKMRDDVRTDALALTISNYLIYACKLEGVPCINNLYYCLPVENNSIRGGWIQVIGDAFSRHHLRHQLMELLQSLKQQLGDDGSGERHASMESDQSHDWTDLDVEHVLERPGISLIHYYALKYGHLSYYEIEKILKAFRVSLAFGSVQCYLLNVKDRHNGNLLICGDGSILHIDFGFILEASPGGDLGFEKAPFKLTPEMIELLAVTPATLRAMYCRIATLVDQLRRRVPLSHSNPPSSYFSYQPTSSVFEKMSDRELRKSVTRASLDRGRSTNGWNALRGESAKGSSRQEHSSGGGLCDYRALCIAQFLAVRKLHSLVVSTCWLSYQSGLPCFKKKGYANIVGRLAVGLDDDEVIALMNSLIDRAAESKSTLWYDRVQHWQQGIEY